jgi:uncharacterized lipoprotein YajG
MNRTTSRLRLLTAVALFASTVLMAGCSSDKVTKTTTTEQTTATAPSPVTTSTSTTTTRQTQ